MTDGDERPPSGRRSEGDGTAIAVDGVSLSFGDLSVLEDVSLDVAAGEFVGLVGPNGAGKTTLLRAISGALEPDTGRIEIDRTDVHDVGSRTSSRLVSVVRQDTSLSFSFPVRDVVAMGRHPYRSRFSGPSEADRERVERALERTRTAELAERPIDEISGGQRQRVVLARAIAQETPALLLDEPTASLDINHQIDTLELVRELVADGRAVVAAIHDLTLAARYCDRLALLADSGVHSVGPPADVLTTDALSTAFDATATVATNPVTGTKTVTALPHETLRSAARRPTDSDSRSGSGSNSDSDSDSDSRSGSRSTGDSSNSTGKAANSTEEASNVRIHVLGSGTTAAGVLARLETASVESAADTAADPNTADNCAAGTPVDLEVSVGPVPRGDVTVDIADQFDSECLAADPFSSLPTEETDRTERLLRTADVVVLADPVESGGGVVGDLLEATGASDSFAPEKTVVVSDPSSTSTPDRTLGDGGTGWLAEQCRELGYEATPETVLEEVAAVLERRDESGSIE